MDEDDESYEKRAAAKRRRAAQKQRQKEEEQERMKMLEAEAGNLSANAASGALTYEFFLPASAGKSRLDRDVACLVTLVLVTH